MPFWAFYMFACSALAIIGWRGHSTAPFLILAGLLGVRVTALLPPVLNEIGSCAVWLVIGAGLMWFRCYLASALILLSSFVYLPLVVFGFRIETLGLLPVVSDLFLIGAIFVSGVGPYQRARDRFANRRGMGGFFVPLASGEAKSSSRSNPAVRTEQK